MKRKSGCNRARTQHEELRMTTQQQANTETRASGHAAEWKNENAVDRTWTIRTTRLYNVRSSMRDVRAKEASPVPGGEIVDVSGSPAKTLNSIVGQPHCSISSRLGN